MLGDDNKYLQRNPSSEPASVSGGTRPLASDAIKTLEDLAPHASYSLMDTLNRDPNARDDGNDHAPRQVFSGHYVTVAPTPIEHPEYITHSPTLFRELNFDDNLAQSNDFMAMFSGDLSQVPEPLRSVGWACGYALSIYGSEYYHQCPFQTGNGYGDGRAVSVLEAVLNGKRWEMQLKGGGRTPYCRGADGRAVLRSSVREFLAQEHMHALGIPTSRSLSLYASKTEKVQRPWYSEGSRSENPDILVLDPVAISTRVAPSFIRVGQLELFGRRARKQEHPQAMQELEQIVLHLIDREYATDIDTTLSLPDKVIQLASVFRQRLTALVAHWIRVGYCQGNFNSDNCAAGGFTLDYGPFGFMDAFDPRFQPWTGGGEHFSFLNQPKAAERNYYSFCTAVQPLLIGHPDQMQQLIELHSGFAAAMQTAMERMWADKFGLNAYNDALCKELLSLMAETQVDYTLFFRALSELPDSIEPLKTSFYQPDRLAQSSQDHLNQRWAAWLQRWHALLANEASEQNARSDVIQKMKRVNPKYTMREWFVVPAYQQAMQGDYALVRELQTVMTQPYSEQSRDVEDRYYRLKPLALFQTGGLSHYSCSS